MRHEILGGGGDIRCSVVILTYARDGILQDVLRGLSEALAGRRDYEVVLVDNNVDGIDRLAFLKGFNSAQYVQCGVNKGIVARNDGMDLARGEFIISLDDDVFMKTRNFIDVFAEIFDSDQSIGLINSKKLSVDTMSVSDQAIPHTRKDIDIEKPFFTFRFTGGCIAIRSSMHRMLGGYSSEFFWGGEEIEYGYRIIDAGWKIYYTPDVVAVEHEHPGGRRDFVTVETERLTFKLVTSYLHMPFPHVLANILVYPLYHYRYRKGQVRVISGVAGFFRWLLRTSRPRRKPIGPAAQAYIRSCGGAIWR